MVNKLILAAGMTFVVSLFLSTGKQLTAQPAYPLDFSKPLLPMGMRTMHQPGDRIFLEKQLPATLVTHT